MGPLKPESPPSQKLQPVVQEQGWSTPLLSSGPGLPHSRTLPGSVSAQAMTPATDPPRYTFAPSSSLNKTARPFGAPPPADSAPQQNGYVGPARPLPTLCPSCPSAAGLSALHLSLPGTVRQRPLVAGAGPAGSGPLLRGCGSCPGGALLGSSEPASAPRWHPGVGVWFGAH